jgi:hypothetical protein
MLDGVKHNRDASKVAETLKRERKTMSSMWTAVSDLDYYAQFNPEPPKEEPEPDHPEPPAELEAAWEEADRNEVFNA